MVKYTLENNVIIHRNYGHAEVFGLMLATDLLHSSSKFKILPRDAYPNASHPISISVTEDGKVIVDAIFEIDDIDKANDHIDAIFVACSLSSVVNYSGDVWFEEVEEIND